MTATVISSLDFITSIIAGVVIFSILGALSKETKVPLDQVTFLKNKVNNCRLTYFFQIVQGGQGLAFIAYPTALARLPVPQVRHNTILDLFIDLWFRFGQSCSSSCSSFWGLIQSLLFLRLSSQLFMMGWDNLLYFHWFSHKDFFQIPTLKRFKPIMTFLLCMSCFLISLPCMSYSGLITRHHFTHFYIPHCP